MDQSAPLPTAHSLRLGSQIVPVTVTGPSIGLRQPRSARGGSPPPRRYLLAVYDDVRFDAVRGSPGADVGADLPRLLSARRGVRDGDVERVRPHLHGDAPRAPKLVAEVDDESGVADSNEHAAGPSLLFVGERPGQGNPSSGPWPATRL